MTSTSTSNRLLVSLPDGRTEDICEQSEEANWSAQQVILTIFSRLAIDHRNEECKALALWACGKGLRLQLMPEHPIKQTREKMCAMIRNIPEIDAPDKETETDDRSGPDCPEIVFKLARNGFYWEADSEIEDPTILRLLYAEAKANIRDNLFPVLSLPRERLLDLRVLEELLEMNATNRTSVDCTEVAKEICSALKYKNSLKKLSFKRSLSKTARIVKRQNSSITYESMNEIERYQKYLEICSQLDCYGGFIFEGQMERTFWESLTHGEIYDKKVALIINSKGFHIVNRHCPKAGKCFTLEQLEYGIILPQKEKYHPCLTIKDTESTKLYQIFTYHASFINKTLQSLQDHLKQQQKGNGNAIVGVEA